MKDNFDKGLKILGMATSDYIELMASNKDVDIRLLISMLQSGELLSYRNYRFESGPFKGHRFLCTSPNTKLMNKHPGFNVLFIDGPVGLQTSSLITYDQKIVSLDKQWQKLL